MTHSNFLDPELFTPASIDPEQEAVSRMISFVSE